MNVAVSQLLAMFRSAVTASEIGSCVLRPHIMRDASRRFKAAQCAFNRSLLSPAGIDSSCRGSLRSENSGYECEQTYLVRLQIALNRILKTWIFLICRGYGIAELPYANFSVHLNEVSGATGRNLQSRESRVRGYVISSTVPVIIIIRSRSLYISLLLVSILSLLFFLASCLK